MALVHTILGRLPYVVTPGPLATDCWIAQRKPNQGTGYARINLGGGRIVGAHRFSYEARNGPIPAGWQVCHHCDVRLCVNPSHLYLGDHADNARDRESRGRHAGGYPKTPPETVRRICADYTAGETPTAIAKREGLCVQTVTRFVREAGLTRRKVA